MTTEPVDLSELEEIRTRLHSDIRMHLKEDIATFLIPHFPDVSTN